MVVRVQDTSAWRVPHPSLFSVQGVTKVIFSTFRQIFSNSGAHGMPRLRALRVWNRAQCWGQAERTPSPMQSWIMSVALTEVCLTTLHQQDATLYQNLLLHVYMKLNMFRATHRPSSRAQNCTSSLWFCIRERLLDVEVAGHCHLTLIASNIISTSNSLSCMQNQRLLVQFWAPDDGRCVAWNMLSFTT
jgi:hypothetical protein